MISVCCTSLLNLRSTMLKIFGLALFVQLFIIDLWTKILFLWERKLENWEGRISNSMLDYNLLKYQSCQFKIQDRIKRPKYKLRWKTNWFSIPISTQKKLLGDKQRKNSLFYYRKKMSYFGIKALLERPHLITSFWRNLSDSKFWNLNFNPPPFPSFKSLTRLHYWLVVIRTEIVQLHIMIFMAFAL